MESIAEFCYVDMYIRYIRFIYMYVNAAADAKSFQSCPTLSDPMDCRPPGSSIHEIFQARLLEWGAIAFSEMEYYSAIKKNKIMPFAVIWMDLEIAILSKVSQPEKYKYHMISLTSGIVKKKMVQMNLFTK